MAAIVGSVTPISDIGKMVNIGTLLAFVIVSISVMVLRPYKSRPAPSIPDPVGAPHPNTRDVVTNGYMMYKLGWVNWARLIIWLVIGLVVYFTYSQKHSRVQQLAASERKPAPSMTD